MLLKLNVCINWPTLQAYLYRKGWGQYVNEHFRNLIFFLFTLGKDISCELDVNREVNAVYVVKLLIFQCFCGQ